MMRNEMRKARKDSQKRDLRIQRMEMASFPELTRFELTNEVIA